MCPFSSQKGPSFIQILYARNSLYLHNFSQLDPPFENLWMCHYFIALRLWVLFTILNQFKVSFDDVCHMDSVITRVAMSEMEPEKFAVCRPHIKQTKKLLKEALGAERGADDTMEDEGTLSKSN